MKSIFKNVLEKFGYKLSNTRLMIQPFLEDKAILKLDFDHVLSRYLIEKNDMENFTFLQIGAFDGIMCDPLYKYLIKYPWKGVMLEPQPAPYKKLSRLYEGRSGINVINAAISREKGKVLLYIIESHTAPEWAQGVASFSRENIVKHKDVIPGIENMIKSIEVDAISFESLLNTCPLGQLDLLQIDTEGYDVEILKLFPFHFIKPSIIHFESKHIPKQKLEISLSSLIEMGYFIARDKDEDMMAVLSI